MRTAAQIKADEELQARLVKVKAILPLQNWTAHECMRFSMSSLTSTDSMIGVSPDTRQLTKDVARCQKEHRKVVRKEYYERWTAESVRIMNVLSAAGFRVRRYGYSIHVTGGGL